MDPSHPKWVRVAVPERDRKSWGPFRRQEGECNTKRVVKGWYSPRIDFISNASKGASHREQGGTDSFRVGDAQPLIGKLTHKSPKLTFAREMVPYGSREFAEKGEGNSCHKEGGGQKLLIPYRKEEECKLVFAEGGGSLPLLALSFTVR